MELKVWVDGVVRVVCGLSEETSCEDVVIALAQAIGQTGRYVLIQKLRDTERQLLANERPLESLAKLGQLGSEVQFFLRRTGPSSSDGPAPDRGFPLPKLPEPEPPKRREPKKSLTFNLGPSCSPRTKIKQFKKPPRDSPEQRASPTPPPPAPSNSVSKDEVYRQVLQQQEMLHALQAHLEALDREAWELEQPPAPDPRWMEELELLDQTVRRNAAELAHEDFWEKELRVEVGREQGMHRQLEDVRSKMDGCGRRLHDLAARSTQLEQEIQQETSRSAPPPSEETLAALKAEVQRQQHHGAELEDSLTDTERVLERVEKLLQVKNQELDELNKELRQCNLQQFIQQAGVPASQSQARTDLQEQLELELARLLPEGSCSKDSVPFPTESPPRPTAKQFLGNPRNLQNPLVSRLNPEGVYV
ncbi:hypothetical protein MATL_G00142900 [Megalops atlanticus]|uniref:Ras-associating domain-containing protein n=1 Tax=Megalops atlanticus TaxID=7932 RepID=A0A9D3T3U4_MEGAT|nr:hypothetical protein MATL_G00142900 [Megalops atlanticus]